MIRLHGGLSWFNVLHNWDDTQVSLFNETQMEDDSLLFFLNKAQRDQRAFFSLPLLTFPPFPPSSLWQQIKQNPSGLRLNCKAAVFLCHFNVVVYFFCGLLLFLFFWLTHLARGNLGRRVDVRLSLEVRPSAQYFSNCCQFAADCQIAPCVRRMLPLGLHLDGMQGWKRFSTCVSELTLSFLLLFFLSSLYFLF